MSPAPRPMLAVFGSSTAAPDSGLYKQAHALAKAMAKSGWGIVTGGYGGVMEAANKAATEAGAPSVGITTRAFDAFPERRANGYLGEHRVHETLLQRTDDLIQSASAYAIFAGQAGTLAEAALLWAKMRAGILGGKPVVLIGGMWENILSALRAADFLSDNEISRCHLAASPEDAATFLKGWNSL